VVETLGVAGSYVTERTAPAGAKNSLFFDYASPSKRSPSGKFTAGEVVFDDHFIVYILFFAERDSLAGPFDRGSVVQRPASIVGRGSKFRCEASRPEPALLAKHSPHHANVPRTSGPVLGKGRPNSHREGLPLRLVAGIPSLPI